MSKKGFVSWADELRKWQDALATRDPKSLLVAGHENKQGMRVTYRNTKSVEEHTRFLERKAAEEEAGTTTGSLHFVRGG